MLHFTRTRSRHYARGTAGLSYVVTRDGDAWLVLVFRNADQVDSTHTDTARDGKAIASQYEALGDDYRSADHGHRSRFTEAVLRAYRSEA